MYHGVVRKIRQLEIEREAIKRENDKQKIETLTKVIKELNEERDRIKSRWETERSFIEKIQKEKKNIEKYPSLVRFFKMNYNNYYSAASTSSKLSFGSFVALTCRQKGAVSPVMIINPSGNVISSESIRA